MRNVHKILVRKYEEKRGHPKDPSIGERLISEQILKKQSGRVQTEFIWLRTGTSGGLL